MDRIEEIFVRLLEKSPGIALTVFVILLMRFLLRNYPKKYTGLLWAGLGIRLLWVNPVVWKGIPSVKNPVSRVFGRTAIISREGAEGMIRNVGGTAGAPIWAVAGEVGVPSPNSVNKGQILVYAGALIWITGLLLFLGYFLISYIRMKRRVRFAVLLRDNIYECGEIGSPFVLGVAKPVIYLPFHMKEEQQRAVICHENCHIRRKDYLVKMFAFLMLGIYWFHPLVWVSYILMCRDMEMSCDEMTVEQSGVCNRQSYSAVLLAFASERSFMGNMLGFGEHYVSKRIRNILKFRVPGKGKRAALTLVCGFLIPVLGCEVTHGEEAKKAASGTAKELHHASAPYVGDASAVNESEEASTAIIGGADGPTSIFIAGKINKTELEDAIGGYLLMKHEAMLTDKNGFPVVSFTELESELSSNQDKETYTAYLWVMCKSYDYSEAEGITEKETLYRPARMELKMDENGEYQLLNYWFLEDEDPEIAETVLHENVPSDLWEEMQDGEPYRAELEAECERQVKELEEALGNVSGAPDSSKH